MDRNTIKKQILRIEKEIDEKIRSLYELVDVYVDTKSYKNTVYFLDTKISEIDFWPNDRRIRNCLKSRNISTIGDMAGMSFEDLTRTRNLGGSSLLALCHTLTEYGQACGLAEKDLFEELAFYKCLLLYARQHGGI